MQQSGTVRGYALAALALILATLVRWLVDPYLGGYTPFPTYFVAVAFVGLYGGVGPSVLTALIGGLLAGVLFLPPRGTIGLVSAENWVAIGMFGFGSALIVALTEWLRVSSASLAAIVSTAHEGIVTVDLDGRVTGWNPGAERLYGYRRHEMLGASIERLAPPSRTEEARWIVAEVQAGRPLEALETERVRKDGQRVDVLVSAAPVRDARGRVTGVASIERDVTERKRVERARRTSEARLQAIIDNAPVVLFIKDLEGRYFLVNPTYLELFQTPLERVLGSTDFDRFPAETARCFRDHDQEVVSSGEARKFEESIEVDGEVRTFVTTKFPLRDDQGEVYAVCGIATDITEETRRHEQLVDLDRRKDQFLSMLAHELRNPLAPIANAVQLIRMRGYREDHDVGWAAEVIERQVRHLTRMVDDLLDIARFNTGRVQLRREQVSLTTLARQVVEDLRSRFEAAGVELRLSLNGDDLPVNADGARITQIMDNLLDNAAKYTEPGGTVDVTVFEQNEHCVLSVRDTGIGIDPGDAEHVFELFEQVDDSLDRSRGGLGLGLNLVKRLVQMHSGSVSLHSAGRGHGCEFVVRLPRDPAGAAADGHVRPAQDPAHGVAGAGTDPLSQTSDAARHNAGPPGRVLVLEDNADTARSMEMLLGAHGCDVRVALTGREGLALAAQRVPELVLVDLGLPDMDGYQVARSLRERFGARPQLIALTGYGQEEHRRRTREAGFDEHLLKPLSAEALGRVMAVPHR